MVGLAATLCAYAIFVNKAKLIRTVLLGVLAIIIASNFVSNDSPAMKYVNGVVDIFATGGKIQEAAVLTYVNDNWQWLHPLLLIIRFGDVETDSVTLCKTKHQIRTYFTLVI